jgi:hypothetical protein
MPSQPVALAAALQKAFRLALNLMKAVTKRILGTTF